MKKRNLGDFAQALEDKGLLVEAVLSDPLQPVGYLTYDSRDLGENTLFVCKGAAFKEIYLQQVIEKGIAGYVSEKVYENIDADVPHLLVTDIRKAMPVLAGLFYDDAWKELNLTGITGTKGKSTTTYYIKSILDTWMQETGGKATGVISSIDTYDGVIFEESHLTTPEVMDLHKHFRNAVDSGIRYMEMEVSSQGLKYDRVAGITFDVGIFLNISEDHISPLEHPTMEDYFQSKLRIFENTRHAVVNLDSDRADEVLKASEAAEDRLTFSQKDPSADIYAYDVRKEEGEIRFNVRFKGNEEAQMAAFDEPFALTMPGLFNVENALAAIACSLFYQVPLRVMQEGLLIARSSGRMEVYTSKDNKVVAIVDYAHNKLSFEKLFESTAIEYPGYHIVSIYGCPGVKALLRRKDLAEVAVRYASKIYIVAEDPGLEPFDHICEDMLQYIKPSGCPYEIIEDRGEAIRKAVLETQEPTVLLITGKGNETRQKYGAEYLPCVSDVEITKKALAEYNEMR